MSDLSLLSLITHAGPLVKLIMLALLLASIVSWSFIFQKAWLLKKLQQQVEEFETNFWSGIDLTKLYNKLIAQRKELSCLEKVFVAGFKEFARLYKQSFSPDALTTATQRMLRVALSKEIEQAEKNLNDLATIGSVSPYVGLFGTVWGIMTSFQALGGSGQATLSMVAPGISEALVATAMGLFVAIPAVVAYNRCSHRVQYLTYRYTLFAEEFMAVLHKQAHSKKPVVLDQPTAEVHN